MTDYRHDIKVHVRECEDRTPEMEIVIDSKKPYALQFHAAAVLNPISWGSARAELIRDFTAAITTQQKAELDEAITKANEVLDALGDVQK